MLSAQKGKNMEKLKEGQVAYRDLTKEERMFVNSEVRNSAEFTKSSKSGAFSMMLNTPDGTMEVLCPRRTGLPKVQEGGLSVAAPEQKPSESSASSEEDEIEAEDKRDGKDSVAKVIKNCTIRYFVQFLLALIVGVIVYMLMMAPMRSEREAKIDASRSTVTTQSNWVNSQLSDPESQLNQRMADLQK